MTAARSGARPGLASAGVAQRLLGVVRPEFRADVLVFRATDPVFGGGPCAVVQCSHSARGHGLCQGHHLRWVNGGRPDVASFAASTNPLWHRQQPNMVCAVSGCGYGSAGGGLCQLHRQRWQRSGRPELSAWLADPPAIPQPRSATCLIGHCRIWPQAAGPFCHAHTASWRANGKPEAQAFADGFTAAGATEDDVIRLSGLSRQLCLELQYALQCRHDERTTKTQPSVVMQLVRFLAASQTVSLLQDTEESWREQIPGRCSRGGGALLLYARRRVADLIDGHGWTGEYPRDVWQLRRLGFTGNQTLDFTAICQPWLRSLVKQWLRWRLGTGLNLETARRGLRSLTRFSGYCQRAGVPGMAGIDRLVLEGYLADLHTELAGRQRHGDSIGQLNSFLAAIRQHGWDDTLPATALLFTDDYPKRSERPPRALAEHVMAQIEDPNNLDRWTNPAYRLVTLILIRAGLRVSDALGLAHDCIVTDADAAPYLRYYNHKMKREALVPIDAEPAALISGQQHRVHQTHPGAPVLFPRPTKNPDGVAVTTSGTYRGALYRWLDDCEIRDERAQPVHLTPHQWRHTLGTRLINRDVPQEVVRRILDHDSPQMTAHYARLHDTTVRRHWEAARTVGITGQSVNVDPDGPLGQATWAKQRIDRATQALPNGCCALPVQQTCPHANACLTCPMFATTTAYLAEHCTHRDQVAQIITAAQARNQTRLVEMNQQVLANLDRIITTLQAEPPTGQETAHAG